MTLQELITRYTFDIDTKPLDNVNEKLENLVGFASKVGISVAAAAGAMFGFAKTTANAGEEALKASQKFGLTTEAYQELMFAARGESEALKGGLLFLNKAMDAASGGAKEQSQAFKTLGVAFKNADGTMRSTDAVLMDITKQFETMPSGAKKVGLAMDIFGKSGANLIPFFAQGSEEIARLREEAVLTGYVMSGQAIQDADKFNDTMDDLTNTVIGLRNTVGAGLMPIISALMKRFQGWLIVNREVIKTKINEFFKVLTLYISRAVKLGEALYTTVEGLSRVFGGLGNMIGIAATALIIFSGAKILYGIGQLAMGIGALTKMFTMANLAALAIPIAIGAAIVIIGLMIEDIYQFFTGGDSVLGTWVEAFGMIFKSVAAMAEEFLMYLGDKFKAWGNSIATFILSIFQPMLDMLTKVGNFLGGGIKAMNFKGMIEPFSQAAKGNFGLNPGNSSGSVVGNANNQNNAIQLQQTINVGQGVDPVEVGRQVQGKTGNALDSSLRGAQRAFGTGGY